MKELRCPGRPRILSPEQVQAIRTHTRAYSDYGEQTAIKMAQRFGISQTLVYMIRNGEAYADVPEDYLSTHAREIRELLEAMDEYEQAQFERISERSELSNL